MKRERNNKYEFGEDIEWCDKEWCDNEVNQMTDTLLSARNMIDLALLALENDEDNLVPTAIEEAYAKLQTLVDEYCVVVR